MDHAVQIETLRGHLTANRISASRRDFVESLLAQFTRRGENERALSGSQWYWVERLNNETSTAAPVMTGNAQWSTGAATVLGWLRHARTAGLRRPTITYPSGVAFKLPLETSQYNGTQTFFVFMNRVYVGRFTDGVFFAGREAANAAGLMTALDAIMGNPFEAAVSAGHATGNCCFCSRELTDQRSVGAGYGPVCATHYGLPWGDAGSVAVADAASIAARVAAAEQRDAAATPNVNPFGSEVIRRVVRPSIPRPAPLPVVPAALANVPSFTDGGPDDEDRAFIA